MAIAIQKGLCVYETWMKLDYIPVLNVLLITDNTWDFKKNQF